ncbi:MAG: DEAD/DEAH box helicase [Planctomycetes bacterium]|nr:DEAD/DEAH box helicase [Planctomycetota bacterium]
MGVPPQLALERIARELENRTLGAASEVVTLTDFQYKLFDELAGSQSVSVSAPTSAGKSFVMGLDLVRRLRSEPRACVVYLVPTRALIRQVSRDLREHLRKSGLDGVPVRTVPFPIDVSRATQGAVFVLTQERLISLLYSPGIDQPISTLVVDEAQGISDGARGVMLQTSIEIVRSRFPHAEIHFAMPMATNPELLLETIGRRASGHTLSLSQSPVAQNVILVSEVSRQPRHAEFSLVADGKTLDLGQRELEFELRGSSHTQRAMLARAVTSEGESAILYANTASEAEKLAAALVELIPPRDAPDERIRELIEFIQTEVHPEYPLITCLPSGVAYHYGVMPAIVRARIEDLFRSGKLRYLCCTSTLLQGVNLPARHIVVENPKRGVSRPMERRDFLNLAGRAGRLLHEFHGNVWCLRPAKWQNASFAGDQTYEVQTAVDSAMEDGGRIVQRVANNEASASELDYGEAMLGKLYCDFVCENQDLTSSRWRTRENAATLEATARALSAMKVTLPARILQANRAVRPDRLQELYEYFSREADLGLLAPLAPYAVGANDRLGKIIQTVETILGGVQNDSHRFYKQLAIQWVYDKRLSQIIARHIEYQRSRGGSQSVSSMIRELLEVLEENIRFRLVKYFMAYNSVLAHAMRMRGDDMAAETLEPLHVYLECGASNRIALNLIALGLSRATALAVHQQIEFPEDATPEDCLAVLRVTDVRLLSMPRLCAREIMELTGRE